MEEYENIKSEKNIKQISKYVLKDTLFSFLSEKKKLEIIIYNKDLQKKLDINIGNYKRISIRYRVGERNGKGKEYNYDDILLFEGEYLNGKRNGKGKEYDYDGKFLFEGEYLNGERNGKGKEYYKDCYFNPQRNGKVKEYYKDKIKFKGEYLNGERNGKGKEYNYDDKLIFEGEYFNERRWNGKGYDVKNNLKFEIKNGEKKYRI